MNRLIGIFVKYPKTTILAVLLLTVFFGSQLKHLKMETDAKANLPQDHPAFIYDEVVQDIFNSQDVIILSIIDEGKDGIFNRETLALAERLSEDIKRMDGVIEKDLLSISEIKNIRGSATGFSVDRFMPEVPETPEEMAALKKSLTENDTYMGSIISDDGTATTILAKLEKGKEARAKVYRQIMERLAKEPSGRQKFYVAGRPVIEVTFGIYMQHSMQRMMPIVMVVIVLMLAWIFRSIRGVILPLLVVIAADVWALGIMAMVGVPLYTMSTNLPIILMAVGIADGIHVLERYYLMAGEDPSRPAADIVKDTFGEMWVPVVITSLTTAAGFASLITHQMIPNRMFGLFTAVGVLAAMIFSLTLIPAALSLLKVKGNFKHTQPAGETSKVALHGVLGRLLAGMGRAMHDHRGRVLVVSVFVLALFGYGVSLMHTDSSWIGTFSEDTEIRTADKVLNDKFDGTLRLNVIFEGDKQYDMQQPKLLQAIARMQADIEKDEGVGGSLSIADFVRRMNQVMNEGQKTFQIVPDTQDLIAQYLLLYSMSGEPGDFDEYVDYDYKKANAIFFLNTDYTGVLNRVVGRLRKSLESDSGFKGVKANFAGNGFLSLAWTESLLSGQFWSIVSSLIAVFFITMIMFRSVFAGLINIVPISGSMIISYGALGLVGEPLTVGSAIAAGIIIGIGVDYTVHFISRYKLAVQRGEDGLGATRTTMLTSGRAITYNAFVVIAGFMVLFASDFQPSWILGIMVALGMFTSFAMAMTLLPALINIFRPKFVFKK